MTQRLAQLDQSGASDKQPAVWDDANGTWGPDGDVHLDFVGIGAAPDAAGLVRLLVANPTDDTFTIVALSTSHGANADSGDINIDKAILVKHHKDYTSTPGYAHQFQVYAEAGMYGIIIGANGYTGDGGAGPYAPTESEEANKSIRFELGPFWPRSEVGRFNNGGDFIVGWTEVRKHTASQSGTTVTSTVGSFSASDVGKWFCWSDLPSVAGASGKRAASDRITGFTSSSVVTVERSRTIASQKGRVCTAQILLDHVGNIELIGDLTVGDDLTVVDDVAIGGDLAVTGATTVANLTVTGTLTGGTTTSTGELLMQDGVTAPPVPLETEARDDWLYQG